MQCPCCGSDMGPAARDCGCGARFVGEPLDDTPFKVQRLGPAMSAVGLLVLVVSASLIFTKWMALAAALVMWAAWRAIRLARREPEGYGGYRTASATLAVTVLASIVSAGYSVAYVSEYLQLRRDRQQATTRANIIHVQALLEEYMRRYGAYPPSLQALKIYVPLNPRDSGDPLEDPLSVQLSVVDTITIDSAKSDRPSSIGRVPMGPVSSSTERPLGTTATSTLVTTTPCRWWNSANKLASKTGWMCMGLGTTAAAQLELRSSTSSNPGSGHVGQPSSSRPPKVGSVPRKSTSQKTTSTSPSSTMN